jgi:hypothetical protein
MLLGPAILIVLRIYLQIYVEHNDRLNRIAQRMPTARAPTLPFACEGEIAAVDGTQRDMLAEHGGHTPASADGNR